MYMRQKQFKFLKDNNTNTPTQDELGTEYYNHQINHLEERIEQLQQELTQRNSIIDRLSTVPPELRYKIILKESIIESDRPQWTIESTKHQHYESILNSIIDNNLFDDETYIDVNGETRLRTKIKIFGV